MPLTAEDQMGLSKTLHSYDAAATIANAITAIESLEDTGTPPIEVNTAITTVGNGTLTAAGIDGRLITRTGPTAVYTDTTDTAAAIIAANDQFATFGVGQSFEFSIRNNVPFAQTISAGAGVTMTTTVLPGNSVGKFLLVYTGAGAVSIALISNPDLPFKLDNTVVTGTGTMVAGAMEGAENVSLTASGQAAITLTTRTAAQIQAGVPNWKIGQSYRLRIINKNTGLLTTAGGSNVTMTSTIPTNHVADYSVTFTDATTITAVQLTIVPLSLYDPVGGVAAGYKVARGVHQQAAASDTIVSGLATVVAVVAGFRDTPTAKQTYLTTSIGDQAGTPAAGSFLSKTFKSTYAAADDFTDNLSFNWIAIGT